MALFEYHGRSNRGQPVQGRVESSTMDAVASQLIGRGITPIKINEVSPSANLLRKLNTYLGADNIKKEALVMFCRQMFTITKAGIPITRGLRGLSASVKHEHFQEVLNQVADRLEAGSSLSKAMAQFPKIFDSLFISMISVGETSGKLDLVFKQIGIYMEQDEETKKRVKTATRYPSFVLIAIGLAVILVNLFVIPEFSKLFSKFDIALPLPTIILIGMSDFMLNYWPFLLIASIGAVIGIVRYLKTEQGELNWGRYKLKLSIIGGIIERASMARYSRSLSLMLNAGVPITQALKLCATSIDNPYLSDKIQNIRAGVERGETLLRTHQQAHMFTPLVLQMVAVGEESGQLENLLLEVAEFYEREVDYDLKTLTDRLEPILIVIMAGFVAVLALGIFLPMWGLYDAQLGK